MRDYDKFIAELYNAAIMSRRGKSGFAETRGLSLSSAEVVEFLRRDGCENVYFSGMLRWYWMVPLWMVHELGGRMWIVVNDEIYEIPDYGRETLGADLLSMLREWRGDGAEHGNTYARAVLCGVFPVA